ncbi:hypothetical protein PNU83_09085 [Turicibacter sanguinis]|uniref:hypothetical protein n=1 Tax=Turicibacter sanguinis TaxID=154288 RepID=UPI001898FD13|nr:hypothetical protein [Turicibacter sanguinis]MDB8564268.1 hypothetical protein [Turicibacter sanguinis]
MNYYQYLADKLLAAIPDDSTDLANSSEIIIHEFPDGEIYKLEYKGYNGLMANSKNGNTGGRKPKLGYFDFKVHTGQRYARLYGYNLVTHYNLFRDLLENSNLENCIQVYRGENPLEVGNSIDEQQALLSLALLMFEQEVNWGRFQFQKNSKFPPNLDNPAQTRPRDMIMGMLLQAFELGIENVDTWIYAGDYPKTAWFGPEGYSKYNRKEYFETKLREINAGDALVTGEYYNKFIRKVSNKRNNPYFD